MAARGRYRDALRHRDLRLLISSFLIDQIGSWSYLAVIAVYVFDRTHSTQWLAVLGVCRWGPGLLLASYGGVLADRFERTTVFIVSSLVCAAPLTGMAVVVALDAPVVLVLVVTALASVAVAPYQPAAGALLIRQGEPADALWILARGELAVCVTVAGSAAQELAPVTARGYVGEVGLLKGIPRTATVRARQDSTQLRIAGPDFLAAMEAGRPGPSLLAVAGARLARTPGPQPA